MISSQQISKSPPQNNWPFEKPPLPHCADPKEIVNDPVALGTLPNEFVTSFVINCHIIVHFICAVAGIFIRRDILIFANAICVSGQLINS